MKPKRNKKYIPKPCVLPLNMRRAITFELPGYVTSLALGQGHFCEQHLYDLLSNADMVRRIAPDGHPILANGREGLFSARTAIDVSTRRVLVSIIHFPHNNPLSHHKDEALGLFDDPRLAYAAYCEAAKRLHGQFARLD